eukprot:CAMPEP_0182843156 /NCGR_PEP_ID=MMETSP0006_2-20121128/26034_1 /TAXON_ID=97485 /ORGANISM="Prymnesium parvum, Strain Texoma1" /LENGTH=105 /DNA_ID=CAMNT_0024972923 /DNA_START=1464 /DNA_END=1781 /DNA_ORIENTATION=-
MAIPMHTLLVLTAKEQYWNSSLAACPDSSPCLTDMPSMWATYSIGVKSNGNVRTSHNCTGSVDIRVVLHEWGNSDPSHLTTSRAATLKISKGAWEGTSVSRQSRL